MLGDSMLNGLSIISPIEKNDIGGDDDLGDTDIIQQDNNIYCSQLGVDLKKSDSKPKNLLQDTDLPILGICL